MKTLTGRFFDQASIHSEQVCFAHRTDDGWQTLTWSQTEERVRAVMSGLIATGVQPGDRIVLISENSPDWAIFDLAVMGIGALIVPAYVTHTVDDLIHIFDLVNPKAVIVSTSDLANRVIQASERSAGFEMLYHRNVCDASIEMSAVKRIISWESLFSYDPRAAELHHSDDSETCCLIFTSGTSGLPKAAMLSHRSIGANIDAAVSILKRFNFGSHDRFLSFLPLAHAYEHTAGLHMPIALGAEIWFCESTEKLQAYLPEVKPTVATAVPRLYDLLYSRINSQIKTASVFKQSLFALTLRLGFKKIEQKQLTLFERLSDWVVDRLVRNKIRDRFGGRIRYFISGGAPLNPKVGEFFTALGVGIIQGYGQTEASPLISVNRPDCVKLDSVGRAFDGVELRVTEDNELLVRGDCVMNGYWNDPDATRTTVIDGWLHTGDLASIDEDGFVRIIGRKKDLIVTSGGENIAPSKIESLLVSEPEIEQAVVFGNARPWLGAVIVPSEGGGGECMSLDQAVRRAIGRVNQHVSSAERVRKFVLQDFLCSVDNGFLTPTQKLKRHKILEHHHKAIESLYRS